jgi:hypothetical protein
MPPETPATATATQTPTKGATAADAKAAVTAVGSANAAACASDGSLLATASNTEAGMNESLAAVLRKIASWWKGRSQKLS